MPADIGQILKPIRKRSFQHYGADILRKAGYGPQFFCRPRISDVQQNFFLILDEERNAWNDVINSYRGHDQVANGHRFLFRQAPQNQNRRRLGFTRNSGKIRPNAVVKDIFFEGAHRFVDPQTLMTVPLPYKIIDQASESHDVIEMDVRDENVLDVFLAF